MTKYSCIALIFLISCTTAKVPVSNSFSSNATRMPVKGLNGWMTNQQLTFGDYQTSKVRRGWDFDASVQYTKFSIRPEDVLLRVFDIHTDRKNNYQRNKYQYVIGSGPLEAEIYATEKFQEKQLVYKSNNPHIGSATQTTKYEYSFTAGIVPLSPGAEPWSLVLINKYDIRADHRRSIFEAPKFEEEGYATNGKENIAIRPLRLDSVSTSKGDTRKVFGGKMFAGYELLMNNSVIGVVDILDNSIWMENGLLPFHKLMVAAIASSIMLKRMQDVEKDKEKFD